MYRTIKLMPLLSILTLSRRELLPWQVKSSGVGETKTLKGTFAVGVAGKGLITDILQSWNSTSARRQRVRVRDWTIPDIVLNNKLLQMKRTIKMTSTCHGSGQPVGTHTSNAPQGSTKTDDCIFHYACSTLSIGLLFKEFQDAIREGDGDREERIWKMLMLIFKAKVRRKGSRTKYAFEAFRYLALLNWLRTPWIAHKLKWGRFIIWGSWYKHCMWSSSGTWGQEGKRTTFWCGR